MLGPEGYELNAPEPGAIALIGRDYGRNEEREGQPFVGRAGRLLNNCLREAGLRRERLNILNVVNRQPPGNRFEAHRRADVRSGIALLQHTLAELEPKLIVCFGNEASHAVIPEWPDARRRSANGRTELIHTGDIFGATGIEQRRGYLWDTPFGPALSTVHPAYADRSWKPFRTLLSFDLARAKETHEDITAHGYLRRPRREVEVVTSSRSAQRALDALRGHEYLAADIETWGEGDLACIGFAGQGGRAFVFPQERASHARELLEDPDLSFVWANGIYDLFVLKHREGWSVERSSHHDVQLLWHAMYPELAGKAENGRKNKMTRKSLAFLASLCTLDPWWKGEYETEHEFFIYNGKDCGITLSIWEHFLPRAAEAGALNTYEHSRALMLPCVDALQRGLRVNEALRCERVRRLEERYEELYESMNALAVPLIRREAENVDTHLFEQIDPTCPCCRHGEKKQRACWECAGLESGYRRNDLVRLAIRRGVEHSGKTVAELEDVLLSVCEECGGKEREEYFEFNPNSDAQQKVLLYDVLKLPPRTSGGKLTTDENALKSLAGVVS